MTARQIAWRLFLTSWLVYALHFSANVVREHYPAIALGDRFSFDLGDYCGLHPDLFETPGHGCHIGNNPGASMVAAIPYALSRPIIDPIVAAVLRRRAASGDSAPPAFNTPWPNSQRFYQRAWAGGLDIKLGLAALVTQVLCMAPGSALGVVLMFMLLRGILKNDRHAMWLSLLYAFGTPIFFRTGFLNHNLMLGHIAFAGFALVWNPWRGTRLQDRTRDFLCGLGAGISILFDYSGVVFIGTLFAYVLLKRFREGGVALAARRGFAFFLGTLPGVFLLWFYQWKAFGHPFYPGQHWMPPVRWIELGYQGYQFPPEPELLFLLLFDLRFGLFVAGPILLLALAEPFLNRGLRRVTPTLEQVALLGISLAMIVFFAGNNYTRLQFNTGLRYLQPIIPFLFVPAAIALTRLRPLAAYAWALVAILVSWPLAMYRDVETPLGVLHPIIMTFTRGFGLPLLTTLGMTSGQYGDYFAHGVSPLPAFALAGVLIWMIWSGRFRKASL